MSTTVRNLIADTLVDIGVLAVGETPPANEEAFAFRKFNRMIDTLKTERLAIFTITRTTKALTASDGEYTVGDGGDINIDRPVYIDHVNLLDTTPDPDAETPLLEMTDEEYQVLTNKAQEADRPSHWYYNPTHGANARGTLTLWPAPTGSYSIAIYVPTAVDEFTALTDVISLPPGYREMLSSNLALQLYPSYRIPPDPLIVDQADKSKMKIKRANRRRAYQKFDAATGVYGEYDILTDRWF